jgi:primosomal protein N' (replication factor Y)
VALAVPLAKLFEYALPPDVPVHVGDRVVVPLGARQRIGVVLETHAESALPPGRMKPIAAVRDDAPRLSAEWLELMRFLSSYYQRPLGETIVSALPPRLRSVKPLPRKALVPPKDAPLARFVPTHELRAEQMDAMQRIARSSGQFEAFLLHGVTGSGKTEVYLHLIASVIERGGQALVLVPEISLTPQLEERFRHAFPEARLAVMHSGLEDIARTAAWLQAARGEAAIVLGTRLALLAPLPKLGIVVVDEEHDPSFKQQEGLRYSARDAAVYLARLAGCPVVLGTATPSLETWHNWRSGRYQRLELSERAAPGARLPVIRVLDMRSESIDSGFTAALLSAIAKRRELGEQSLVFINRRGYAPVLACEACGWIAACARCTARMVLHSVDRWDAAHNGSRKRCRRDFQAPVSCASTATVRGGAASWRERSKGCGAARATSSSAHSFSPRATTSPT